MARAAKKPAPLAMTNAFAIAVACIVESITNPRRRWGDMEALTASVAEHGVIEPVLVRERGKGSYELVVGARRFRAAKAAELTEIPCIVHEMTDEEVEEIQLVENNQREDVGPIEEGDAFARQLERGKSIVDIAKRLGRTPKYVEQRIRIAGASEPVRSLVERGFLGLGGALLLAAVPAKEQEKICDSLARDDEEPRITVNEVLEEIGVWDRSLAKASFDIAAANVVAGVGPCTHCPKNSTAQLSLLDGPPPEAKCLDETCWDAKTKARFAQVVAEAEAAGLAVIRPTSGYGGYQRVDEYAEEIFEDDFDAEPLDSDNSDDVADDEDAQRDAWVDDPKHSWGALTTERVLVIPKYGEPFLAVPAAAVDRILVERGLATEAPTPEGAKTNDAAHREAQAIAGRKLELAMQDILAFIGDNGISSLWPDIACAVLDRAGFDVCKRIVQRRGLTAKEHPYQGYDYVGAVRAIVDDLSIVELQGLIVELLLWNYATQTWNAESTPWASALDVCRVEDLDCENRARAELAPKPKRSKKSEPA